MSYQAPRSRFRKIQERPAPSSHWDKFSRNPLTALLIGFVLTGLVGTWLTNRYTAKQKELEFSRQEEQRNREHERDKHERDLEAQRAENQRKLDQEHDDREKHLQFERAARQHVLDAERSFSDELNKTRVEKIAEVWEIISIYEATVEAGINRFEVIFSRTAAPNSTATELKSLVDEINEEYDKLRSEWETHHLKAISILTKNRFWLADKDYQTCNMYIDLTQSYLMALRNYLNARRFPLSADKLAQFETDLRRKAKQRERLRGDVIRIRNNLLAGR
jgi:hypothetical protein